MAYIPTVLYETGYPSGGGSTLYTVPASTNIIVKNIVLTNTTNNESTLTLHLIPPGGSAQNSNRILSNFAVPANGVSALDCSIVMPTGAALYGVNGTASAVTVTISGVRIT